MNIPGKLLEEDRRSESYPQDWLVLFRQAEKEYLDLLASKEPMKFPNKHFCSEGHKHQLISVSGERLCCSCGLIAGRVCKPGYGCLDIKNTIRQKENKMSISGRFKSFCTRRKITYFDLSEGEKRLIEGDIQKVRDAEKPERKTLPNFSILTYQICKRLDIEMDEKLLNIPVSKVTHDRCRKVFQTLGWEYAEYFFNAC